MNFILINFFLYRDGPLLDKILLKEFREKKIQGYFMKIISHNYINYGCCGLYNKPSC